MPSNSSSASERPQHSQMAVVQLDSGGELGPIAPVGGSTLDEAPAKGPPLTDAELVQLQVRMIALENLVIALLADSSATQRERARQMVAHISPRPGFTPHRLTLHAAAQMTHLVDRAEQILFAPSSLGT